MYSMDSFLDASIILSTFWGAVQKRGHLLD